MGIVIHKNKKMMHTIKEQHIVQSHERAMTMSQTSPMSLSMQSNPNNAMMQQQQFPVSVNNPLPKSMAAIELAAYANAAIGYNAPSQSSYPSNAPLPLSVDPISPSDDIYKDMVEIVYDQNQKEIVDVGSGNAAMQTLPEGTETMN